MEDIGQRLKDFIEEKELTMLSFSELVGIQRSSLSHLFSGRNKPSIDLLLKIKRQFPEIDLDWIISGQTKESTVEASVQEEKAINTDVTNVNTNDYKSDNQSNDDDNFKNDSSKEEINSIDQIVIFYQNGSFKEYKNR